jgi:hypothetical protein
MFLNLSEMVFFGEIHVVLLSVEKTCLEERDPISSLKNFSYTEYSILKLTVFSPGNNVVDTPASDTNGFL